MPTATNHTYEQDGERWCSTLDAARVLGLDAYEHELKIRRLVARALAEPPLLNLSLWRNSRASFEGLNVRVIEWHPSVQAHIDRSITAVLKEDARWWAAHRARQAAAAVEQGTQSTS